MPRTQVQSKPPPRELPAFVEPMLASAGEPFDSDRHVFEVKWDGTRGLAFVERRRVRIMNRRGVDIADRYPELVAALGGLPDGTILDGEVVVLGPDGKPDFAALQSREQARTRLRIDSMSKSKPATYVAFDQVYRRYSPIMGLPCEMRRDALRQTTKRHAGDRLIVSEGVVGAGRAFFDNAVAEGLEGVVAKRLDSPYLPGRRSEAWTKIKRCQTLLCLVIGFVPEGDRDLSSVLVATDVDGTLTYVGRVGSGFTERQRLELVARLRAKLRPGPLVDVRHKGALWVEPEVVCIVRCMERTPDGMLRAPVFGGFRC